MEDIIGRIWLKMFHSANQDLLHGFLSQYHQVYDSQAQFDCPNTCDLFILDFLTFQEMRSAIETCRKESEPLLVPVLLLAHASEVDRALDSLYFVVDEVLIMPLKKKEALLRINTLLRMRKLSVTLQQTYHSQHAMTQRLQALNGQLHDLNQQLDRLAHQDGLTKVANRLAFDEFLQAEWQRQRREQQPLTLILCDVDYFKAYNDTYGHPAGDRCLITVAQTLVAAVRRPADSVARYGGEEFAILLPNTNCPGAIQVVQAIMQAITTAAIPHAQSPVSDRVTLSYGIASTVPQLGQDVENLLQAADQGLYEAKHQGRNRYYVQQCASA